MKKPVKYLLVLMLIFFMIGVQAKVIYDYSRMDYSHALYPDELEADSYMDPPKTPYSLKTLVENLQNASIDTTDTDGDGLYDTVEYVIGTDYNNTDTDFDYLNDTYEIYNCSSDPLNLDSNFDEFPDYFEVEGIYSLDVDGDGILNVWDFDNDDDGVKDGLDISPFGKSTIHSDFDLTVKTDGKPINLNLQLVPEKDEHLKLYYQTWNWPSDDEGTMKDLDNSKDDVRIAPWLRVTPNDLPSQSEVSDRGIFIKSDAMEMPLFPTFDQGHIAAFHGTFFYPERAAMDLTLNVEFFWKVTGYTDLPARAYNASNGKTAVIRNDGVVVANSSNLNAGTLQFIDLGDDLVALKIQDGQFLTVLNNDIIASNGSSIGTREKFTYTNHGGNSISLRAYNGDYVTRGVGDVLEATSSSVITFEEINMGYAPDATPLAFYNEPFRITGLGIEENFGCNLSVFYHEDKNETIAATMLLTYEFTRNETTVINEMPAILASHNITTYNQTIFSRVDNYEALTYMSNELIPTALDNFSGSQIVPLTFITEESAKIVDMRDNFGAFQYIMGDSLTIDFTGESTTTMKTLKTNFYNSSTYQSLNLEAIFDETETWGMDNNSIYTIQVMMLMWHTTIKIVTNSTVELNFTPPENSYITTINAVALIGLSALGVLASLALTLVAYKALTNLLEIPSKLRGLVTSAKSFQALKSVSNLGALAGGSTKLTKALQFVCKYHVLDIIGALIGIGLAIWAGCEIAKSIGGRLGDELGAAYGVAGSLVAVVYAIVLAVLFSTVIGAVVAVILIILDLIFGFSSKVTEWLAKVFFGTPHDYHHAEPSTDIEGALDIDTFDLDGNGLDVGDKIQVTAHLVGTVIGKGDSKTLQGWSYNVPWIRIKSSWLSGSQTSMNLEHALSNDAWNWPDQTDLLNRTQEGSSGTSRSDKYDSAAWIKPGISMVNFPVKLQVASRYKLMSKWYHKPFWYFGAKCWHTEYKKGATPAEDLTTLYFDVMPKNFNDFLKWGALSVNDYDVDGLNDTYEISEGKTHRYRYDTDADGLNDRYELEIGTDPASADTDEDSLIDSHEAIYGCNITNGDTDDDGIYDFLEVAGWAISFNYCHQVFEMRVYSDPTKNDTDGDGVADDTEYWCGLNPRSKDTNGNGTQDVGSPQVEKTGILDNITNIVNDIANFTANASELAIDANGYVYLPIRNGTGSDYFILKLDNNLNYYGNWSLPYQPGKVAVDDVNGFLYVENLTGTGFGRYQLDGTLINESQAASGIPVVGIDVDSNGYLYVARFIPSTTAQIDKYFSNGTYMATFWNYGSDPDEFDNLSAIAVDADHEMIFALDGNRVVKINSSTGEYIATLPNGYYNMIDLATDIDGWVYVLDHFDPVLGEGCVRKFDHNGMEDRNFILTNSSNTPPWYITHYPMRLAISQNVTNTSYVVIEEPMIQNPNPNILKFFENVTLIPPQINGTLYDWDGDELENLKEVIGWSVSYRNSSTNYQLYVNSSPFMMDTDFDGLSDYEEYNLRTHPWNPDTDGDGLSDLYEFEIGTNLTNDDTDDDGLPDPSELLQGSNAINDDDTDDDGLDDLLEFILGSNPASNDTDNDGADDQTEYDGNSSLFDPDTDGDYLLDGPEYFFGCDPNNTDTDNDGLLDGEEISVYNTNATLNDTDADGLLDGMEIDLWLDPLNNDTDEDGLLDGFELEWGSNPYNNDTDYDGVNDSADADFQGNFTNEIILSYDVDPTNSSSDFVDNLADIGNVTAVSVGNLIANHTKASYIVLVGMPDPYNSSSVGGLMYDLLKDAGDELAAIMENNSRHIAVRRGVFTSNQTIVMLSQALYLDAGKVFGILKGKNITKTSDSVTIKLNTAPIMHSNNTYMYGLTIDEIDTVKATDSVVSIILGNWSLPTIEINRYNYSSTPHQTSFSSGLGINEARMNKYLEVNLWTNGTLVEEVPQAVIVIFYKHSDLDLDGNGYYKDPWDLNENDLMLYFFNETTNTWVKLSTALNWVIEVYVNTTDIEVYGELYAGYVIAVVTHLSLFSIAGLPYSAQWGADFIILTAALLLALAFGVAYEAVRRDKEEYFASKERKKKESLHKKSRKVKKTVIREIGTVGSMENIEWEIKDMQLNLVVDISKELRPSSTGKSTIVAGSRGSRRLKGIGLSLGMVAYKYPEEKSIKIRARRKREMQNIEIKLEGNIATFIIDVTKELGPSSTGKTMLVASSRGAGTIEGTDVVFTLNVYKKKR